MTTLRRIVLTRQEQQNRPWAERLRAAGHAVLELPLLRYRALVTRADQVQAKGCDWILFTSPHAATAFFALGVDTGRARLTCLGGGTARALAEAGRRDVLDLDTRDGVEFAAAFVSCVAPPGRLLLPGAARRLTEPRATLEATGFIVDEVALYDTEAVPPAELPTAPLQADDLVFFASPSAVRAFVGAYAERPECITIGETTARAALEAGFPSAVAATPDLEAMVLAAGLDPLVTAEPRSGS